MVVPARSAVIPIMVWAAHLDSSNGDDDPLDAKQQWETNSASPASLVSSGRILEGRAVQTTGRKNLHHKFTNNAYIE